MTEQVQSQPVPGVTVTQPASNIDAHFKALIDVARGCAGHLLSAQSFFKAMVEAQMWAAHAVHETAQLKAQQAELKKQAEGMIKTQ